MAPTSIPPCYRRLAMLAAQLGAVAEAHDHADLTVVVLGDCVLQELVDEAIFVGTGDWYQVRVMRQALCFLETCLRLSVPPEVEGSMLWFLAEMAASLVSALRGVRANISELPSG